MNELVILAKGEGKHFKSTLHQKFNSLLFQGFIVPTPKSVQLNFILIP